ncbi:MAG TPA: acetyltransferase [Vicinamibacterales bacterium]|jgi:sugar O-acyltransferase (sialic acid O-acetyltransferase NeuD family)|nr:acetyltransferase [Vicinamibacterales bacterium]
MARLVIFGAGDIARLAHYYFSHDSSHEVAGFVVDRQFRKDDHFLGLRLSDAEDAPRDYPPSEYEMFVALSYARMNAVRAEKYEAMKQHGYRLVSYVSSRCTYLSEHQPGDNCFILEDNTIQPFVRIGNDVTLWSGNHVGHDAVIEDHCFVTSHVVISGYVRVGTRSFIGVNATLRNSITIAPQTLVGAGAVIMKDTKPKGVYIPERARLFSKSSDEIEP